MILGLLWVVVYYISSGDVSVLKLGAWNGAVGLGTMMVGFLMTLGGARAPTLTRPRVGPHAGIVHAERNVSQAFLEASCVRAGERQGRSSRLRAAARGRRLRPRTIVCAASAVRAGWDGLC